LAKRQLNKIRIIAGRFRGRHITVADSPGLRPTGDRLRETLFSWLQPYIADTRVLDLFAGSGALGFEAASRGALQVMMIERSRKVCAGLRQNAAQLEVDNVSIFCADALDLPDDQTIADETFDIVFVDPPFAEQLHQAVIDMLSQSKRLAKNALIIIESDRRSPPLKIPDGWQLQKDKAAGEVQLQLYISP